MEDNMMLFCHNTCTHNHEGTLIYPGEAMSSPLPLPGLLDKCLPSNTKSSQLLNSLQSVRPQPSYHRLPFSHAGRVPQEALYSEREECVVQKTKLFTTMVSRPQVWHHPLNISLLFIHVRINLPTIVPLNHHWENLATNILSLPTLHSQDNMPIFLVLLVILTHFTRM